MPIKVIMKCAGYKNLPQGGEAEFPADEANELIAKKWAVPVDGSSPPVAPVIPTPTIQRTTGPQVVMTSGTNEKRNDANTSTSNR